MFSKMRFISSSNFHQSIYYLLAYCRCRFQEHPAQHEIYWKIESNHEKKTSNLRESKIPSARQTPASLGVFYSKHTGAIGSHFKLFIESSLWSFLVAKPYTLREMRWQHFFGSIWWCLFIQFTTNGIGAMVKHRLDNMPWYFKLLLERIDESMDVLYHIIYKYIHIHTV